MSNDYDKQKIIDPLNQWAMIKKQEKNQIGRYTATDFEDNEPSPRFGQELEVTLF